MFREYLSYEVQHDKVYILNRLYSERLESFYRKKLQNAHSIGKTHLLVSFGLSENWSISDLVTYVLHSKKDRSLDKHLWTTSEITGLFNVNATEVEPINIKDQKLLDLLDIKSLPTVNSSASLKIDASIHSLTDSEKKALQRFHDQN